MNVTNEPQTRALVGMLESTIEQLHSKAAVLLTTLPRGGLQVIQTADVEESALRAYHRLGHRHDFLAWSTLARNEGRFVSQETAEPGYVEHVLAPLRAGHALAVPISAPVFDGFPGVVVIFRRLSQPAYTADDIKLLSEAVASQLTVGAPSEDVRQAVFDTEGRLLFPSATGAGLSRLDHAFKKHIRPRLTSGDLKRRSDEGFRVNVEQEDGQLQPFRVVVEQDYAALGGGSVVFVSKQPDSEASSHLVPSQFAADPEISRLIPAFKFMHDNFARGPSLDEISQTVHLSPFHFHRRFTQLLGITPKHYLFDCQLAEAKRLLLANTDLAEAARLCGFAHQSHFTSRFKQGSGLTPTRWQRLMRDKAAGR